ncbi:MAG: N-acetylmuramic acid 6-phosphate etherase [Bacteroidota bacterium]
MTLKTTEQSSHYNQLELMSTQQLLENINREDRSVPEAVSKALPQIEAVVEAVYQKMSKGGRLFYLGSGTSGRLGVVDASECPPTFGVPHDWVIGLIAGGEGAIHKAVEHAEDDEAAAWKDLQAHQISPDDFVFGITASGTTPYVIGAAKACMENGIQTGGISCNENSLLSLSVDYPVEVIVGPEFVTGSTRMKAGTAQKLVLNMISTSVMIKLGRVQGNRMIDMQLTNDKLIDRGTRMIMDSSKLDYQSARAMLNQHGSVRAVLEQLG